MKFSTNKVEVTAVIFVLVLTIATTLMTFLPIANAAEFNTYAFLSVAPNPIGVDQTATIVMWLSDLPPTAMGAQGDRWEGFEVAITKPDGSKETLGPYESDPVGSAWTLYPVDQIGTYTLQFSFPGQQIVGVNFFGMPFDDTYRASVSPIVELVVQEDPLPGWPANPPTDDYWERPLDALNHDWHVLGSNWLMTGYDTTDRAFDGGCAYAPNNRAPNSAHIMWTKPITFGGLSGDYDSTGYYVGLSYEQMFKPPVIINGVLYYNTGAPPRYGCTAVDLLTGEEIWQKNYTISFGQIFDYESPNQHGTIAYLWEVVGGGGGWFGPALPATWKMYDAFTGNWILDIGDVPSGTTAFGPHGELLVYVLNAQGNWLAMWNSTLAIPPPAPTGSEYWQWRPDNYRGQTLNGTVGIQWNVTVPAVPGQSIRVVLDDIIFATAGGPGFFGMPSSPYTFVAYDRYTGEQLWVATQTRPDVPAPRSILVSQPVRDGVLTEYVQETMQWYGYDWSTGENIWVTDSYENAFGMYATGNLIGYDRLYTSGYDGIVHCYNLTTGELLWEYSSGNAGFVTPYGTWPFWNGLTIADGKVFACTNEHSPGAPIWQGEKLHVIDAYTGESVWNISGLFQQGQAADGYYTTLNGADNQIYCFGKGPSATTVSAPLTAATLGSSIMVTGTVTDQTPASKDTPAMSDESMSAWMEYLHMQMPCPEDATGVTVKLTAIDPNGNFQDISEVTTDLSGTFGKSWIPPVPGEYFIMAEFEGSASYGSSFDTTYLTVDPVPTPYPEAPTAEEVAQKTIDKLPAYPEAPSAEDVAQETIDKLPAYPEIPEYPEYPEAPEYTTIDLIIIAAVVIAIIIGLYNIVRKQRK